MFTADGYMRCDVCGTYIFLEQYPNHRRACGRTEPTVATTLQHAVLAQLSAAGLPEGGVDQAELRQRRERQQQQQQRRSQRSSAGAAASSSGSAIDTVSDAELLAQFDPQTFGRASGTPGASSGPVSSGSSSKGAT
eukprot:RCo038246